MEKNFNPFIMTDKIPEKYFCDREKETEWFCRLIANGHNIVLISPRRMGKTSLMEHCYRQKSIEEKYYTFYVDILPTTSLAEMAYLLGKKIYEQLLPFGQRALHKFFSFLSSMRGVLGYDAISGMPTFTLSSGAVSNPQLTLEEIFKYLSEAGKPCIITIDEFQQIGNYPEKNVEALLRSHIQKMENCRFVFSGSERHIMMQMFNDQNRPFYNSATTIDLRAIPIDTYTDFVMRNFREFDKMADPESIHDIYDMMHGNTYYMQWICNEAFSLTSKGCKADKEVMELALSHVLEINDAYFRERMSMVGAKQKALLYALAQVGEAPEIFSSEFLRVHQLGTASSVQYASKRLLEAGLITVSEGIYSVSNKLLAEWIRRNIL